MSKAVMQAIHFLQYDKHKNIANNPNDLPQQL